jgi:hypothetical protein
VRADPSLMESFACEMDAAVYHSSLVGTTTFQQRAVTHQMLRAAASKTLATCVRARRSSLSAGICCSAVAVRSRAAGRAPRGELCWHFFSRAGTCPSPRLAVESRSKSTQKQCP